MEYKFENDLECEITNIKKQNHDDFKFTTKNDFIIIVSERKKNNEYFSCFRKFIYSYLKKQLNIEKKEILNLYYKIDDFNYVKA